MSAGGKTPFQVCSDTCSFLLQTKAREKVIAKEAAQRLS